MLRFLRVSAAAVPGATTIAAPAASPTVQQSLPSVIDAGHVMAELNDWRAIVFVLVFIIVCMILERIWMQREMRIERQQMRLVAQQFGTSAEKVGEALSALRVEIGILRAVSSRVESVSADPYGGAHGAR